jgi:hypothetical protein
MHCNHCGKEFEPIADKWGNFPNVCPDCPYHCEKGADRFCIGCGSLLQKTPRKRHGKIVYSTSGYFYCPECKQAKEKKEAEARIRRCVVCGEILTGIAHKYCPDHKPTSCNGKNHNLHVIQWQKNNPEKLKAAQFALYRPDTVYILYECRCKHTKKHNHHFNYKLKNLVIRLCPACHAAEHKRLRDLAKSEQSEAI